MATTDMEPFNGNVTMTSSSAPLATEQHVDITNVAWGTCTALLSVLTITGNLMLILVIVKSPQLRTITNGLIVSLAVSELTIGICVLPFASAAALNGRWTFNDRFCEFTGVIFAACCTAVLYTVAVISIDRCVAVTMPLKYNSMISPIMAGMMIAYIWIHSFIFALLPVFNWSRYQYVDTIFLCSIRWTEGTDFVITTSTFCVIVPSIILAIMLFIVIKSANAQKRVFTFLPMPGIVIAPIASPPATYRKPALASMKILFIIVAVVAVLWVPYTILQIYDYINPRQVSRDIVSWFFWLALLSNGINPIVFLSNTKYNQQIREIYDHYCSKQRVFPENTVTQRTLSSAVLSSTEGPGPSNAHNNNKEATEGASLPLSSTSQGKKSKAEGKKPAPPRVEPRPRHNSLRRGSATISLRQALKVQAKQK